MRSKPVILVTLLAAFLVNRDTTLVNVALRRWCANCTPPPRSCSGSWLGRSGEIASVVGVLADEAARWVTAQNIRVNGSAA